MSRRITAFCSVLAFLGLALSLSQWETQPVSGPRTTSRHSFGGVLFRGPRKLVIFGGRSETGVLGDLWHFSFLSKGWTQSTVDPSCPTCVPSAREGHSLVKMYDETEDSTVSLDIALMFGGETEQFHLNDVWQLNATDYTWKELKPPPTNTIKPAARVRHCAVTFQGIMYVFGGFSDEGNMNDVWMFDFGSGNTANRNKWSTIEFPADVNVPSRRYGHSCVRYGSGTSSRIVVFGGLGVNNQPLRDLWALKINSANPSKSKWERIDISSPPPSARQGHAATLLGPKMVIHGGQGNEGLGSRKALRDVWMLDIDNKRWKSISASGDVLGAFQHQFFSIDDTIVAFGGISADGFVLGDVYELKVFESQWTRVVPSGALPAGRYGHSTVITTESLILYGGSDLSKKIMGDVWSFDFATRQWIELTPSITANSVSAPLMAPTGGRALGSSFQLNGQMFVFGGYDKDHAPTGVLSAFHLGSFKWRRVVPSSTDESPAARAKTASVLVKNQLIVVGGVGAAGMFNDVWSLQLDPLPGPEPTNNMFQFDGINDVIATPLKFTPQAFTIEFWLKVREFTTSWQPIMAQGQGISSGIGALRCSKLNTICFLTAAGQLRGQTSINDGQWHHVAFVYDPLVQMRKLIYVDGKEDSNGGADISPVDGIPQSLGQSPVPFIIGSDSSSPRTSYFSGWLDEVRFWSVGRTPQQIAATQFTRLVGSEAQLLGLWNFDNNNYDAGTTADMSSTAAHGIIGDGTLISSPIALASTVPTAAVAPSDDLKVLGAWVKKFQATDADVAAGRAPSLRVGCAITAIGSDTVFLFGGHSDDSAEAYAGPKGEIFNDVWRFNTRSSVWVQVVPLTEDSPQTRMYGHSAIVVDQFNALLIGSITSPTRGDQLAVVPFDTGSFSFSTPSYPSGPPPLAFHSVDSNAFQTVLFGGDYGSSISQVLYTSPTGSTVWERVDPVGTPPPGRFWPQFSHTTDPNRLLLFGGWGLQGPLEDMWEYYVDSGQFFSLPQLGERPSNKTIDGNNGRAEHFFGVWTNPAGKNIGVLFGGETFSRRHNDLTFYDLETYTWSKIEPVNPPSERPSVRGYFPGVIWRNQLWVFGGYNYADSAGNDLVYGDLWRYEFLTNTWFQVKFSDQANYGTDRPDQRWGSKLFIYKDALYVFGGETFANVGTPRKTGRAGRLRDIWRLNLDITTPSSVSTWTQLQTTAELTPPLGRRSPAVTVYRNWLIVFGGLSLNSPAGFGGDVNDVWSLDLDSEPHLWKELKYLGVGPRQRANAAMLTVKQGDTEVGLLYAGISSYPASTYDYLFDVNKLFFELAYPPNCRAVGEALNIAVAGTPSSFKIEAFNIFGVKKTVGGDFFHVELALTSGPSAGARFRAAVVDQYTGEHVVYYTADKVGQYKLTIKTQDTNIGDSGEPFTLNVNPAQVVALATTAEGDGLSTSIAGIEGTFQVTSRDLHTNVGLGGDDVFVFLEGPIRNDSISVVNTLTASVIDHVNGQYSVKYLITVAGLYRTNVLLGNVPAQGSPFSTIIEPGPTVAALSLVHGSGLRDSSAGAASVVIVQTRDSFLNNRTEMGSDDVNILFQGPGDVGKRTVPKPNGVYEITYFPFNPGAYDFSISVKNNQVENAPTLWTSTCDEAHLKKLASGEIACHFPVVVRSVFEPSDAVATILSLTFAVPGACYGFGILIYLTIVIFTMCRRPPPDATPDEKIELDKARMMSVLASLGKIEGATTADTNAAPKVFSPTSVPSAIPVTNGHGLMPSFQMSPQTAMEKLQQLVHAGRLTAEEQAPLASLLMEDNPVVEGAFDVFAGNPTEMAENSLVNRLKRIAQTSLDTQRSASAMSH